mgnify:CR=1 FL=1
MARDSYGRICRAGVLAVSPPDDNGAADFCADMLKSGDHILDRRPGDLMALIADAPREFDGVKADLLRALFADPITQNKRLRKLAEWMREDKHCNDLAFEVLADMAGESQPDYSDED